MRTKFKAWAEPYINEHPEYRIFDEDISSLKDIYLEVGSGKGLFLLEMSKKYPNYNFVGIERNVTCSGFTMKKLVENEVSNAKLIWGDASRLLVNFQDKSVNKIYLNFSDPWPKDRHTKRRLTSELFLSSYYRILKDDGLIVFKTDNEELFDFSKESFTANKFNIIKENRNYDGLDNDDYPTEYETKKRDAGLTIYKIILEKAHD